MEFELVEVPQAPDFPPLRAYVDPRLAHRQRPVAPRQSPDRHDQAVLIPDQEYGS